MADYSNIAVEFPDFPLDTIPADIPEWLECQPWHNDACPIWYERGFDDPEEGIKLCIDWPDPDRRELPAPRFGVWKATAEGECLSNFGSDSWAETLAELERLRTA
jgi:hypothetical protein